MERLVNRYDLIEEVAAGKGRCLWRGHDVVLDRPVGVLVLDVDHPHADKVRAAAQAAARVEHPRVLRVVDADVADGRVVVVTRWMEGNTLAQLLSAGPLTADAALTIVRDLAHALAASARDGVHHLVLDPRDVLVTDQGVVLVGVGVRAALEGVPADGDAEHVDAWRLGAVLYAALTARWPGHPCAGLPAAPTVAGRVARPRQVRAGVPMELDDVAWRTLQPDAPDPLETPAAVAEALDAVARSNPTPTTTRQLPHTPWLVVIAAAVVSLFVVAAALVGWQVWRDATRPEPMPSPLVTGGTAADPSPASTISPPIPLTLVSATAFDPLGNGEENDEAAALAIDGDLETSWQTLTYATRDLGQLKPGVGLRIQLDGEQAVGGIELNLVGQGSDLQIWARKPGDAIPTTAVTTAARPLKRYQKLASIPGAGDQLTYRFAPAVTTGEVLVWLTALPPGLDGYRGGVAEVRLMS